MNITSMDIMQWAMGWSWPIVTVLAVLMACGIARFLMWNEPELTAKAASGASSEDGCVCQ